MSNKSGVSNQVVSLPTGGGALQGIGEKFSPDLHTGTGNFTVPLALPSGRNGFQPQLSLVYSTGTGNGPFGLGWALNIPGVSRKTSKGIPTYAQNGDIYVLSGAEDLVPVEEDEGTTRYVARTEGTFSRILHHYGPGEDYWEVRSKDGLVSFYGTPRPAGAGAEWQDPGIIRDPDPLKWRHVFAWKLTRTVDPFGNRIDYLYERDSSQGGGPRRWDQLYLSEIRYADFDNPQAPQFLIGVRFIYEDRADQFSDYRAGFEIRTRKRCARIEIGARALKELLARTYEFVYLDQRADLPDKNILPLNGVSLLSQIQVVGHDDDQPSETDRTQELAPLEFGYTRFEPSRRAFSPVAGAELPPFSLANPAYEQASLFGNGLPDILEMNGVARYWRNLGNGTFDRPRDMPEAPAGLQLADPGVQLVDANGDGRIDLLVTTQAMSGYFPLRFDGAWSRRSFQRYKVAPSFNLEDPEVKLVDLDGDGVTDAVRSGTRFDCFFNDPEQGWKRTRQVERRSLDDFPNVNFSDTRVKWGDMSGDGLQDIALIYDGSVDYWPNLGYGNWGPRIHMRNSPRLPDGYNPKRILVGDVDGDGLADIVYVDNTQVTLWINQSGDAWSDPIVIKGTPPVSDMDAVRLTDLLGNGVSGVLWSTDFSGLPRRNMFFLDFTGGVKPYLLNEMDNHIGAITRVTYASSTQFYLADQKRTETRWRTPLPFPVQVVARVEAIDELSKGRLTTTYRYHQGYWDGVEREFRGFGMVEQFDSETFAEAFQGPAASSYRFSTVDFPGATSTYLRSINNAGQSVGSQRDANGVFHSLINDTRSFSAFDPPGFTNTSFPGISFANGLNDSGEVVGLVLNNENAGTQAYVKSGDEFSFYQHPDADPSRGTDFEGINNRGVRVGAFTDSADTPHGIIQLGATTTLLEETVDLPVNAGTFIFDINNLGHMVGGYFDAARDVQHGFFTAGKLFVTVDFPGSSTTWLNSINDAGQMAGAYFDDATQIWHGFLTDGRTFKVLDYPDAPGRHTGTFLTGIDNVGRIVGYYGDLNHPSRAGIHGFLATPVSEDGGLRMDGGRRHFSPPTCAKTWFHQGAVGDEFGAFAELDLSAEFWSGDAGLLDHKKGVDAFLRTLDNRRMRRDALRALRGGVLRSELYALDGTERADRPYTVTEHAYGLRLEAVAADGEGPSVFFPHHVAQRATQWERGDDPLTQFTFTDTEDYDSFGQLLRSTSVACPRGWGKLDDLPAEPYLATRTRTTYAAPIDPDAYIFNRVARATSFELKNNGGLTVGDLHSLPDDSPSLVIFGQRYNYYDGPPFQGLPFGQVGPFGALVRAENLALTEEILRDAYRSGNVVLDPPEEPPYLARGGTPPWTDEYPEEFRSSVSALAGYAFHPGGPEAQDAAGFFAQAERLGYDFQSPGANGEGRGLITTSRDPLGRDTEILYDNFDLLPVRVTDPARLVTQAIYDYRVLKARQVTDPNNNLNLFTFTPLGLLKESFIRGKSGEGDQEKPSVRMDYDFLAFQNSKRVDPQIPQPVFVHTTQRVHHDSETDVPAPERDETIEHREYSDGFGRVLQTRTQAEDILFGDSVFGGAVIPADQTDQKGTLADVIGRQRGPADPPNVVVSGWQIYDNKGHVVEKYEPFYSAGYDYGQPSDTQFGQKIEMFYEPRGHVIRAVNPDGSEQRIVFGVPGSIAAPDFGDPDTFEPTPWEAYTYDADDNAGRTHPVAAASYRHCWDTPSNITIDSLGRTVLAVERNRDPAPPGGQLPPMVEIRTRSTYDIRGNLLTVTDALDRTAFTYAYDLTNRQLRIESIDAGIRRTIFDAAGNTIEYRSGKGALCLHAYDALNRPIRFWARDGVGEEMTQREHLIYGDSVESGFTRAQAQAANLLGNLYQHYDEAGRLTCERFDFEGNLVEKIRQVISDQNILSVFNPPPPDWQVQAFRVDWQPTEGGTLEDRVAALLDTVEFRTSTAYDALNRIKSLRYPQDVEQSRKELRPRYNRAGALESVALDGAPYVRHIAYNAKGQRALIAYGNGVMTRYAYDSKMFRLLRLRTENYTQPDPMTFRPAANALQDFAYEYDLTGNITVIHDRTPGSGIPNTPLGTDALDRSFVYDAIYRLLSADGRECDLPPDFPWDDSPRCADLTRTRAYAETYQYDNVGNIIQLQHGANRNFALVDGANRLATMTVGQTTFQYTYDANGNLTQETTSRHFEWDHLDRMRVFRTQTGAAEPSVHAHYLYDSGGQRVKKLVRKQGGQVEGSVYVDGLFEYQSAVQASSRQENNTAHVMDNKSRIALLRVGNAFPDDSTPSVKYHLGDHLGSSNIVIGGTDSTGNGFITREEYTPYGETSFGSVARKRYRFSGKEKDEESGLYYFGMRYYLPWNARWINTDPALGRDDLNLYSYCRGCPLRLVDPAGAQSDDPDNLTFQSTGSGLRQIRPKLDIDEPIPVSAGGAWDDPENKQFMESMTNRATKGPRFQSDTQASRSPISLSEAERVGPEAFRQAAGELLSRRFSEVQELDAITRSARGAMTNVQRDPRELANAINQAIRGRIASGASPEAAVVARAFQAIGIDPQTLEAIPASSTASGSAAPRSPLIIPLAVGTAAGIGGIAALSSLASSGQVRVRIAEEVVRDAEAPRIRVAEVPRIRVAPSVEEDLRAEQEAIAADDAAMEEAAREAGRRSAQRFVARTADEVENVAKVAGSIGSKPTSFTVLVQTSIFRWFQPTFDY